MFTIEFLLTSLVVVLIPGTGVLYTVSTAVVRGLRASVAAAIGCTLGIVPHLLASALGLSAIMQLSAEIFTLVKYAGAAYLLFLAWQMWRDTGALSIQRDVSESSPVRVALKGVALNLLNPKLTAFFFAFMPQFVQPGSSAVPRLLALSAAFMLMTLVVFCIYGLLASAARTAVSSAPQVMRWAQRSLALVFAGLAVNLALSGQE